MTAHIDKQTQETERCDCDPHDVHALQKKVNIEARKKRTAYFLLAVSVWFNVIAFISDLMSR
jgi:hypothetical protein